MKSLRIALAVPIALLALAPGAASAAVYGGATSRGDPVTITVAKSGKLKEMGIAWTASCTSGADYTFGGILVWTARRPSIILPEANPLLGSIKKGRLSATSLSALSFADDTSGLVKQTIRGRVSRKSAAGTWSAHIDVADAEGKTIDTCNTGLFRWSAHSGPNVYGGSTTQGEPVVVQVAASRTRIGYFGFVWDASCPDGSVSISDNFGNFPLTGAGAFGDQWTEDYPASDGSGKASLSYKMAGTLRKGRGSGSLSVDVTMTDANGSNIDSCHTNAVRWSVSQ